jgi:PPIC-type PPIASE domain.
MKVLWILAAGLLLLGTLTVSAQDIGRETRVDSVLASVNGDPITLLDVLIESGREEIRLASMFTGARLYSEIAKLRKLVVDEIIVRKLIYDTYKEKPFPIEDQYIESMLDSLAVTMGGGSRSGLIRKAKELGTTIPELKEKIKEKIAVDVLLSEYCDRMIYITPKDVYDYYVANQKEWTKPAKFNLQLLHIANDGGRSGPDPQMTCKKLLEQFVNADEKLFVQLVRDNSDAPNSESGGSVGFVDQDKLRPEFAPLMKDAKVGKILGPVKTPEGYYFLRIAGIIPEERIPFEKASGEIRNKMDFKAKSERRKQYADQLKSKALIRYYF